MKLTVVTKEPARTIKIPEPVIQLGYGRDGACGLAASGSLYCWQDKPTATKVDSVDVTSFSAGIEQTCAISKTGELCWGPASAKAPPKAITFRF